MTTAKDSADLELPDDVEALKAIVSHVVAEKEAAIASRDATIAALQEQVQLLLARRFAASSERVADGQLGLFNEAEELAADTAPEAEEDDAEAVAVTGHRRRRRGKRAPLPEHLPRVEVVHELPEAERVCPHDGAVLEAFGEDVSEQYDVVPAKVQVLRHRRVKYRCPCCEGRLLSAPMPAQPIPKSQASPGLLAFVATSKYVDGLALYRLSEQFERIGVALPRQTLARWMVQSGDVVVPLINLLRERMLEGGTIHCDETTVQVLDEPGKAPESKSYMWVQAAGTGETPVVLFDYDPTRSGKVPRRLLEGFQGYLQTDAYAGYKRAVDELGLIAVLSMAHARRHFVDALKALGLNPNKLAAKPPDKARRLLTALGYIRTLYSLVETAKANGLEPYAYLRHVLTWLPRAESVDDIDALLPWNVNRESLIL